MKIGFVNPGTTNIGATGLLIVISIIVSSSILLLAIWMVEYKVQSRLTLTQTAIQAYDLLRETALNLRSQPPDQADPEQCVQKLSETLHLLNLSLKERGMHLTVESITVSRDLQAKVEYTVWQGESYVSTFLTTGEGGYGVDLQPDTLRVDVPSRPCRVNISFTVVNTGIKMETITVTGDNVQVAYYQGQDPRVTVQGDSIIIENMQPGESLTGLILEFNVPEGLTTSIAEASVHETEFSDYSLIRWFRQEQLLNLTANINLHAGPQPTKGVAGSNGGVSNLIWDWQAYSGAWGGYLDPDGGSAEDWLQNLEPVPGDGENGGYLYVDNEGNYWIIDADGYIYPADSEGNKLSPGRAGKLVRVVQLPGGQVLQLNWNRDVAGLIGSQTSTRVYLMAGYAYATYSLYVEDLGEAYLTLEAYVNGTIKTYINGVEWNPPITQPGKSPNNITSLLQEGENTIVLVLLSEDWPGPAKPWSGRADAQGLLNVEVRAHAASLIFTGKWESGVPAVVRPTLISWLHLYVYGWSNVPGGLYDWHLRLEAGIENLGGPGIGSQFPIEVSVYVRGFGSDGQSFNGFPASFTYRAGSSFSYQLDVEAYAPSPDLDRIYYDVAHVAWCAPPSEWPPVPTWPWPPPSFATPVQLSECSI